ncbi:MAG: hypothetical protein AB7G80_05010 [Dongiaceae bacterium]
MTDNALAVGYDVVRDLVPVAPSASNFLAPMFYNRAVEDKAASEKEGRPIFREVAFVQIHIPGDKNTVIDRKVRDEDKARWAPLWQAFTAKIETPLEGTPLEQWPALSVSQVAEMKALHITTVEQLAALSELGLQRLGLGAREWQNKAKHFLAFAKDSANAEKLQNEKEVLQKQLQEMQAQLTELKTKLSPQSKARRAKKGE